MTTLTSIEQNITPYPHFTAVTALLGRIGLAAIFFISGINKIQFYEGNAQFLASGGLPEWMLPFVIVFEIGGATALIIGFKVRAAALAFAAFSIVTALLYHNNLADQIQFILFFKNMATAGGFLILVSHGAGPLRLSFSKNNRLEKCPPQVCA
jgi:putative oxidoreductase